ncbi:MAG: substrate-binding domain-containing protein [Deltaproteobacteria bacterium]|nr:substrate-binding domain-containing protein [Deltaproteobacteria bacterium]
MPVTRIVTRSVCILGLLMILGNPLVFAAEVKIGVGGSATEDIFYKIMEPMEKSTGIKLVLVLDGPSAALRSLDNDLVSAAVGGLSFPDWMTMMVKEGYTPNKPTDYKYQEIGRGFIKVIANKNTLVKKLSKDQLKGIFTGKITNWKEVGGADTPIKIVYAKGTSGTNTEFMNKIMDTEPYTKNILEASTAPDLKAKVVATPGAVGLSFVSLVDETVTAPEIPVLERPIVMITKGDIPYNILKVLEYIRGDGQKFLNKDVVKDNTVR